jgi:hypothetical protein
VTFVDEHKNVFGVEPICRVLTAHGAPIAPSTHYASKSRPPSARAVRELRSAAKGRSPMSATCKIDQNRVVGRTQGGNVAGRRRRTPWLRNRPGRTASRQ